jgi:hypothetical protein
MRPSKEDLANDARDLLQKIDKNALLPSLEKMNYADLDKLVVILGEVIVMRKEIA